MKTQVQSIKELINLEKKGVIKLAPETGCKIGKSTIKYIYEVTQRRFEGFEYSEVYVSGCFYPYLYKQKI